MAMMATQKGLKDPLRKARQGRRRMDVRRVLEGISAAKRRKGLPLQRGMS